MGVKPKFSSNHNEDEEINIEKAIHTHNLHMRFVPLHDNDIDELSNGECTKGCNFDKDNLVPESRGVFDKNIFGTKQQYQCKCNTYTKDECLNVDICPSCNSKIICAYSKNMGHIQLEERQENYIFPNTFFSKILIIPLEYRNYSIGDKGITIHPINEAYSHIISRNNRLKKLKEINADEHVLYNEIKFLEDQIFRLYYSSTDYNQYQGVVCEIYDIIKSALIDVSVNFSASARAIVNLELDDSVCKIPYIMAKELFKPYILNLLLKDGLVRSSKEGIKCIESDKYKTEIKDYFENGLLSVRLYLMSKNEQGKILHLSPVISDYNVIEVSKNNYVDLCTNILDKVKIFVLPKNTNLESDDSPIKFAELELKNFYDLLDQLSVEKANNKAKSKQVKLWIQKTNEDQSIVNSIAFKLITGRRHSNKTHFSIEKI